MKATKLQHSAIDNVLKISDAVNEKIDEFLNLLTVDPSKPQLLEDVEKALKRCAMWHYKLATADGKDGSYYSVRHKLKLANQQLDTSRNLLMCHKAPIFNDEDNHRNLGEEIIKNREMTDVN